MRCLCAMRLPLMLFCLAAWAVSSAQDTLRLRLAEAEALLQERSLALLAQRCEVDAATALHVQARLFTNPSVGLEWGIPPRPAQLFEAGQPEREFAVHAEKLFRIAGQRALAMRAASLRITFSEAQYAELAAALRYQLHTALYRQFFLGRAVDAVASQLGVLKNIVDSYGAQLEKGNVSLRDVARLRTSFFELNSGKVELERELHALQEQLGILLAEERYIAFSPDAGDLLALRALPADLPGLVAGAMALRPALQASKAGLAAAEAELELERRNTAPDLMLGVAYDRYGNVWRDYAGITAGLSIPLFDRNQARTALAKAAVRQQQAVLELERNTVRAEVERAYRDLVSLQQQYTSTSMGLAGQLDQLSESLIDNYVKSNLKLIEFTDLFESYTRSIIAINVLEADLQSAYAGLEQAAGQKLFGR